MTDELNEMVQYAEIQGRDVAIPFSHCHCHGPRTGIRCSSLSSSLRLLPSLLSLFTAYLMVSVLHFYNSFLSPLLQLPLFFTRRNPVLSFYFKFFNLSYAVWSLPPTQLILDSFRIDQGPCFGFKKLSRFFPQNIRNYSSLV